MLEIICVWIYIFFTSYAVGSFVINIVDKNSKDESEQELSTYILRSIVGLIPIMIVAGYMSLLLKTGLIINLLLISFSAFYYFTAKKKLPRFSFSLKTGDGTIIIRNLFILASFILILVKSAGPINNPDTGAYHLPLAKWIESYPVIKGLANVHSRLGFNYQYELLCAVYGFSFIKGSTIHALNGYFMLMVVYYLLSSISFYRTKKLSSLDFIKLVVLFFVLNMNNAISSLSPDFPATVLVTMVVLLLMQKIFEGSIYTWDKTGKLAFIIAIGAVLFKISSAPTILFCSFFVLHLFKKNIKIVAFLVLVGVISTLPYFIRNYFISGYLVYPLYSLDVFDPVWKIDKASIVFEKDVIRYWALGVKYGEPIPHGKELLNSWIEYLKRSNSAYVYLVLLLGISLVLSFGILLRDLLKKKYDRFWLFIIFYICLAYWWYNAPDPRFGNGFIVPFIGIVLSVVLQFFIKKIPSVIINATLSVLILLSAYMVKGKALGNVQNNYNRTSYNFITPPPYINPDTVNIGTRAKPSYYILSSDTSFCWESCLPCSYLTSKYEYMGEKIEEGFKHSPLTTNFPDSLKQLYYNK